MTPPLDEVADLAFYLFDTIHALLPTCSTLTAYIQFYKGIKDTPKQ